MKIPKLPITSDRLPNAGIVFLFLAPLIVFFYASYIFNPANMGNVFLYSLQLIADSISIITLLGLWLTIFLDVMVLPHHRIHSPETKHGSQEKVSVDVFIPTAGESIEILKKTIIAAINIRYPHTTYVLDDAKSFVLEAFCKEIGVTYLTRKSRKYAKSGNLNNALQFSKAEFFAIFDADQVAEENFLSVVLPYFQDTELAMVQTPQFIVNTDNFIAAGSAYAQEIFYRFLSPAKNISDSAFCVGTNVVFRRKAIEEINGIAEISHSEDIWTSRLLHEKNWKTLFVNQVLAKGTAPETIRSYFRQQLRWAKGGFGMLFLSNPLTNRNLKLDQRIQYFSANAFYLVGFSILTYILLPIFYLLFGISSLETGGTLNWLAHYVPYVLLYYSLTWLLLGHIRLPLIATAMATFYPYILAFFSIVFNTQENWTPTSTQQTDLQIIMHWIWPHVFLICLTLVALVVGWFDPTNFWDTAVNSILAIWNMYLLIMFLTTKKIENHTHLKNYATH